MAYGNNTSHGSHMTPKKKKKGMKEMYQHHAMKMKGYKMGGAWGSQMAYGSQEPLKTTPARRM